MACLSACLTRSPSFGSGTRGGVAPQVAPPDTHRRSAGPVQGRCRADSGAGGEMLCVAINNHARIAFTEIHPDEKKPAWCSCCTTQTPTMPAGVVVSGRKMSRHTPLRRRRRWERKARQMDRWWLEKHRTVTGATALQEEWVINHSPISGPRQKCYATQVANRFGILIFQGGLHEAFARARKQF